MSQTVNPGHTISTPYQPDADEEYMSDKQLAHFKQILLALKKDLTNDIGKMVNQIQKQSDNYADPLDRANQMEEMNLELRTRDRDSKLIRKINQTLERIREDDYGFCDTCGVEIGLRRLESRPTANLCFDCKSVAEIKERTFAY